VVIIGYGSSHISDLANASAPLTDLANRYIGPWYATFVDLAAISAIIAVILAIHNANFRIMYALGRERLLPRILGRTHGRFQTPHMAIIAYSVLALILGLFFGILWGPIGAFGNVGFFSSLGMLPIYIITNVALIVFMLRQRRSEFNWILHGLMPVLSIAVFIAAFISSVYPLPAAPLNVFPAIVAGWIVLGVIWLLYLLRRNPSQVQLIGNVLFAEPEREPVAAFGVESAGGGQGEPG
jgi:amino acid transporter